MDTLPVELMHMIYEFLPRSVPIDIANLSLVCSWMHNSMPPELARILSIRSRYANINATITNNIQYFISDYDYNDQQKYLKRSLRIVKDGVSSLAKSTLYINIKMGINETPSCDIGPFIPNSRRLISDIYTYPICKWTIDHTFHSVKKQLYEEYKLTE